MVKFYTSNYTYDYPFPTVCLAFFLRYPNPYSTHVLSTDVIDRSYDPETQRMTTTRLHLKRSKLPRAVVALLPRNILASMRGVGGVASAAAEGEGNSSPAGTDAGLGEGTNSRETRSFILETSTIDMKEGWMKTESRNLEWTGVLSVLEKQDYYARGAHLPSIAEDGAPNIRGPADIQEGATDSITTVVLKSNLGQRIRRRYARPTITATTTTASSSQSSTASATSSSSTSSTDQPTPADEAPQKIGFFRSWSQAGLQRSIEAIGLSRTTRSQPNAREGLKVVMERLRDGGLVAVLEGMRRDAEMGLLQFEGGGGAGGGAEAVSGAPSGGLLAAIRARRGDNED